MSDIETPRYGHEEGQDPDVGTEPQPTPEKPAEADSAALRYTREDLREAFDAGYEYATETYWTAEGDDFDAWMGKKEV